MSISKYFYYLYTRIIIYVVQHKYISNVLYTRVYHKMFVSIFKRAYDIHTPFSGMHAPNTYS